MKKHANTYEDEADKTILIRRSEDGRYFWCHPKSGEVHGSTTSDYVTFETVAEATRIASQLGYLVTYD